MWPQLILESALGSLYLVPLCAAFCLTAMLGRSVPFWLPFCGTISAYAAAVAGETMHLPPTISLICGLAASIVSVFFVYHALIRKSVETDQPYVIIIQGIALTLAGHSFLGLISKGFSWTPLSLQSAFKQTVISFGSSTLTMNDALSSILVVLVVISAEWFLKLTKYGVLFRALASNRDRAVDIGVPVTRIENVILLAAAVLTFAAGLVFSLKFDLRAEMMSEPTLRVLSSAVAVNFTRLPLACVIVLAVGTLDSLFLVSPNLAPLSGGLSYAILIAFTVGRTLFSGRKA